MFISEPSCAAWDPVSKTRKITQKETKALRQDWSFKVMCMCVSVPVWVSACECRHLWRSEEVASSPEDGVAGASEKPDVGAGN